MDTFLLTGFSPFDGASVNLSWEAVRALDGRCIADGGAGVRLCARCLPCAFGRAPAALLAALQELRPALVMAVGQSARRRTIALEQRACNRDHAAIADNLGQRPRNRRICAAGPAHYRSTLPLVAMTQAARRAGVAVTVSRDAGGFVCNHVFYQLMHAAPTVPGLAGAGLIHVPHAPAPPCADRLDLTVFALELLAGAAWQAVRGSAATRGKTQ